MEFLKREISAGAAQAALYFIGDQCSMVLSGKRARAGPKRFADAENAAFALNRLEYQGANRVVEFGFKIGDVVKAHELDSGNERLEWLAIFSRVSDRESAEGSAMK